MSEQPKIHRLAVTLEGIDPPIWRLFRASGDTTLGRLHDILQEVMGWENEHLYQFDVEGRSYGPADPELGLDDMEDADGLSLAELVARGVTEFGYEYDFGDGWEHTIVVEATSPAEPSERVPALIEGERACPPEDCGGVWGYLDLLDILAEPDHPQHEEVLEWLGDDFDPDAFDPDEVDRRLESFRS